MSLVLIILAACMLFAVAAIIAGIAWYLSSRGRPRDEEDDRPEPADPIASRGPQVVMPDADDISEGPAFAPPRPAQQVAPQPVVIAPSPRPMAPPPVAPAPSPAAAPRPVGPAIPQAIPRPNVAPSNRNIVERAAPLPRAAPPPGAPAPAPPVAAAPVAAAPVARAATPPPPAPRPPPGIPAGVTIVPNDLTPFGMQNQPRSPALRKKVTPVAAPIPPSDRKKDG